MWISLDWVLLLNWPTSAKEDESLRPWKDCYSELHPDHAI